MSFVTSWRKEQRRQGYWQIKQDTLGYPYSKFYNNRTPWFFSGYFPSKVPTHLKSDVGRLCHACNLNHNWTFMLERSRLYQANRTSKIIGVCYLFLLLVCRYVEFVVGVLCGQKYNDYVVESCLFMCLWLYFVMFFLIRKQAWIYWRWSIYCLFQCFPSRSKWVY